MSNRRIGWNISVSVSQAISLSTEPYLLNFPVYVPISVSVIESVPPRLFPLPLSLSVPSLKSSKEEVSELLMSSFSLIVHEGTRIAQSSHENVAKYKRLRGNTFENISMHWRTLAFSITTPNSTDRKGRWGRLNEFFGVHEMPQISTEALDWLKNI